MFTMLTPPPSSPYTPWNLCACCVVAACGKVSYKVAGPDIRPINCRCFEHVHEHCNLASTCACCPQHHAAFNANDGQHAMRRQRIVDKRSWMVFIAVKRSRGSTVLIVAEQTTSTADNLHASSLQLSTLQAAAQLTFAARPPAASAPRSWGRQIAHIAHPCPKVARPHSHNLPQHSPAPTSPLAVLAEQQLQHQSLRCWQL
jgi:hypothetical protein